MRDYTTKQVKRGRTHVLVVTYKGVDYVVPDEAKKAGLNAFTVKSRIDRNKPFAELFRIGEKLEAEMRLKGDYTMPYETESDFPYGISPVSAFLACESAVFNAINR